MLVAYTLFGVSMQAVAPQVFQLTLSIWQCVSGYVSSRLFASLKGEEWRKNILLTAVLFPGSAPRDHSSLLMLTRLARSALFLFLHLLNFFLIGSGSSGAVPFGTFLAILAMCASTLLTRWRSS